MPQAPALIGKLVESAMGRRARVLDAQQLAPGFLELTLRASPPPGGWQPGHEIQFRVAPTLSRRYTVRSVGGDSTGTGTDLRAGSGPDDKAGHGPDGERIRILASTESQGPGSTWVSRLRAGTETVMLAARHRPLRETGSRRLYLGDGSTLGTIDAYARVSEQSLVAIEVPEPAVEALEARWPRYHFLPVAKAPGDALFFWLERAAGEGEFSRLDGAMLLGHAQSIQRQRAALVDSRILPRRAVTTKPYWATGKAGL
ncbi:hypothetical protein [Streptomyces sp. NBC_00102]|uniref:hypothetical protein n=1 Tax=Streptomyces sp. NBC_00102 TaxID=2975652 RepID=UPI0022598CB6|nr:hypothetical protein [Streptomyces sp. NBC_00102]MCX5397851.1 hypothetical protein [Streptomyces sp. NBC_00102]